MLRSTLLHRKFNTISTCLAKYPVLTPRFFHFPRSLQTLAVLAITWSCTFAQAPAIPGYLDTAPSGLSTVVWLRSVCLLQTATSQLWAGIKAPYRLADENNEAKAKITAIKEPR